jgi:hypothetical protein
MKCFQQNHLRGERVSRSPIHRKNAYEPAELMRGRTENYFHFVRRWGLERPEHQPTIYHRTSKMMTKTKLRVFICFFVNVKNSRKPNMNMMCIIPIHKEFSNGSKYIVRMLLMSGCLKIFAI